MHVPFCRARCDYCEFASVPVAAGTADGRAGAEAARRLDAYVDGIAAEWEREQAAHDVRRLHTLYLGGGTPSLLGPDRLERLLELFRPHLTPHAEVTVETNPEDVDDAYAEWAASAGVRVSLGVQSFSPELRAVLGRTAQADPAAAFRRLRAAGVANAGLDLIHGIPGQTPELLGGDIAAALELRPDHVSWYELDVVEGTALAARLAGGRRALTATSAGLDSAAMPADPMDDVRATGYRRIVRELSRAGYDWYEVSNFALPGRRARHNVAYWRARPYLGLGPGAVSTVGARRWTNAADPEAWAAALVRRRASAACPGDARPRHPCPRALSAGGPLRRARPARRGGRRHRRAPRAQPRGRWIGFPAQWYNPRDAKGEARGRRGVRAPVSLSAFKGVDCHSRLGKSRSCGPSSRSTSRSARPSGPST